MSLDRQRPFPRALTEAAGSRPLRGTDPMTRVLRTFRRPDRPEWENAWVGMEPTFQNRKSVRKWERMSETHAGEEAYFKDAYMLRTQREVADAIAERYRAQRKRGDATCLFRRVRRKEGVDQYQVARQVLTFTWANEALEPFKVRLTLDPETFEYSVHPVPLVWFYEERFVAFLQRFLWEVPRDAGLTPSIAHGGAQFSFSVKTFLTGSLLADQIADRLNHPELSLWIMDWPNPDDRAFRATRERTAAFRRMLASYWAGGFHPRALGGLTPENCYLDQGFGPAANPPSGLMEDAHGPVGDARDVFQTNFAFGRSVRRHAQNVHPGYWQSAHPQSEGYRPDQIMRYGEGNLNRLQIAGEFHVKSAKLLDPWRIPRLRAPLEPRMLTERASWENRAQMGRTSARDYVEALLLDVHHARYLQAHPHVTVQSSILQDQLLADGEETVRKHAAPRAMALLHREARLWNREASQGRIKDDRIEPETLLWAAWRVLPKGEKAAIAREIVTGFVERVEQAAAHDPRPSAGDPMEWHRHRIHPILWDALAAVPGPRDAAARELEAWRSQRDHYLARRPVFSQSDLVPPWEK
jgi:hypothetical protein